MKALIWFGCFFVATILNTLLGQATGIKAGYLVFYLAVYFVAKKLCNLWDEHKTAKGNLKKYDDINYYPIEKNNTVFCKKCGEKLIENSQFCRKCGTIITEESIATVTENDDCKFCEKCGADITHDSENCHVCYHKIIRDKK